MLSPKIWLSDPPRNWHLNVESECDIRYKTRLRISGFRRQHPFHNHLWISHLYVWFWLVCCALRLVQISADLRPLYLLMCVDLRPGGRGGIGPEPKKVKPISEEGGCWPEPMFWGSTAWWSKVVIDLPKKELMHKDLRPGWVVQKRGCTYSWT
jgi:hypothetical protein